MTLSRKGPNRRLLRALFLIPLLLLLGLLFKAEVMDIGYVPSSSMAPTLMEGDVVLINKFFGRFGEPQLFDLVLLEKPETHTRYLKRIAGLPGTSVEIIEGDLFVDGKIASKSEEQFHRQAVALFDSTRDSLEQFWDFKKGQMQQTETGSWLLRGIEKDKPVGVFKKNPYLSPDRERSALIHDAALRIVFSAPSEGTLRAMLGEANDNFYFELNFGARETLSSIRRQRVSKGDEATGGRGLPLPPGTLHELEVGNVDNRLFFLLDGKEIIPAIGYEKNTLFRPVEGQEPMPATSPVVFEYQGARLEIHRVVLLRDIDYAQIGGNGVGQPFRLDEGEYFLLGDNSAVSEDSRLGSFGAVNRRDILGRPWLLVSPISRFRRL